MEYSNGCRPGEKMGAALFSGSIIVGIGFNTYGKTHPNARMNGYNSSVHAEMQCLLKRRYYKDKNLTMYVFREKSIKGKLIPGISKPCRNCYKHLRIAEVKTIRYIDESGFAVQEKL